VVAPLAITRFSFLASGEKYKLKFSFLLFTINLLLIKKHRTSYTPFSAVGEHASIPHQVWWHTSRIMQFQSKHSPSSKASTFLHVEGQEMD
jgi:hypothetical protein